MRHDGKTDCVQRQSEAERFDEICVKEVQHNLHFSLGVEVGWPPLKGLASAENCAMR